MIKVVWTFHKAFERQQTRCVTQLIAKLDQMIGCELWVVWNAVEEYSNLVDFV